MIRVLAVSGKRSAVSGLTLAFLLATLTVRVGSRLTANSRQPGLSGRRRGACGARPLAFVLAALAVVLPAFAESGSGTSPEGPLDIRKREEAPPSLSFSADLVDADNDGICEGEEAILLPITVRNSGKGPATGVRIVLSGSSGLVSRFGAENLVGTIEPGTSVAETLRVNLPPMVTAEEGKSLVVKVKESRPEWGCPDSVSFPIAVRPRKATGTEKPTYTPVDLVPEPRQVDENVVAAVIGISKYREPGVPEVAFAERDAQTVEKYLRNVCGVKAGNMLTLYGDRATKGDLDELFEKKLPAKLKPQSTVYIYFAGHGTPTGKDGRPTLVPYDATATSETKLYPVADIVAKANDWKAKQTVVMLDACFAGENRVVYVEGQRPLVAVDLNQLTQSDKCIVLTASDSSQTANDLPDVKHGLFTYYLLMALRGEGDADKDGWVTLGELYQYVRERVSAEAAERLATEQDPRILPEGVEKTKSGWRVGKAK